MKKKNVFSNVVTTPVLKRELTRVKGDLKHDLTEYVDKRIDMAERVLKEEIRINVQEAEVRLGEKLSQATEKILTHIDPFVKEVRDSYEERGIVAHQISELRDRVDYHDEQIKQLKQR